MNRTIKFRAWDDENGKMLTSIPIMAVSIGSSLEMQGTVLKLMQFTGLLDKNGKEIFEGDILRWKYEDDNGYRIQKGNKIFAVYYNEGTTEYKVGDGESLCGHDYRELEIIGNIHENPDLLTTTH